MNSIDTALRSSSEMLALSLPIPQQQSSSPATAVSQHQNTGIEPGIGLLRREIAASPVDRVVNLTNPENSPLMALFGKINARLGDMKEVAAWKSINDKPTEDLEQESKVLDTAHKMALDHKLDPETWKAFIQAQMDAAKEIQNNYRSQWQKNDTESPTVCRPIEQSRKEIAAIGKEILSLMANGLTSHQKVEEAQDLFMDSLTAEKLSDKTRENLFQKLAAVRFNGDITMDSHLLAP